MVSLNDLRSAPVALDWHEAVAAGAALATLLADAQAPACPHPADVTLLPSGDLRVTGPGHVDGSAAAGVAHVLDQLLESAPCPADLRQLIEAYAGDNRSGAAGVAAVREFVAELAFFERPGRREVLAAVAVRAEPALEQASRAAALEALTERTRLAAGGDPTPVAPAAVEAEPDAADVPRVWNPPDEGGAGRLIVPAVVGLVAFLAVTYVAASWLDRPAPTASRPAEEEDLPISGPATPARPASTPRATQARPPAVAARERQATSQPAGPTPAPPVVDAATPGRTPITAPSTPAAAPVPAPATRAVDVVVAERDGRVVPSPIAPQRPVPRAVPTGRVFQSGDPQVTPAILIRPHLPENPPPDVPEEQIGTLEFVVAESGAVEHVHLVSPANRYQERMLVAAAKTWQFQPATRDGRPVRFRTRIRVTL
jgi:hypothetical protein